MGITRTQQDTATRERSAAADRKTVRSTHMCQTLLDESDVRARSAVDELSGKCDDDKGVDALAWNPNQRSDTDVDRLAPPPPHAISRIATLNRELKALEVRYFRTRLQLEKAVEKNDHLRQDMTKLRSHATKLERETCKLRNLIDRIQSERKQLELQAIHNRDYAKKIEQRFFVGSKGQSVLQCNVALGARVKALETTVQTRDAALESQRLELQDAREKLAIVRRALETRFEALALNGSVHTGLLFELTRVQDECASLARQLSDERTNAKALQRRLDSAQTRELELGDALAVREAVVAGLERERAALDDSLATARSAQHTSAFERATLLKFIQEQAEVKLALEAQVQQLYDTKATELAALHGRLQTAIDERSALQNALRASSIATEQLELERQQLTGSLDDARRETRELEAREQALVTQLQHAQDAAAKCDDDCRAARDVCRELEAAVDAYDSETQALRARVAELEVAVADAQQQLAAKRSEELALRAAMENALRDLEMLSHQRNDAAKAMNEAVTISASSLDEQQQLAATLATQRTQLEQLKRSKSLLQNAMLEQLAALRKQLQLERVQRIEAEAKVQQLVAFTSTRRKQQPQSQPVGEQERSQTSAPFDADEPQPLPPPPIAGAPSPLPPQLGSLGRLHGPAHYECSSSSSSSSDSDDDELERADANDAPLPPLGVARAPSHSPLSHSPEHHAGHAVVSLEAPISLLELAEGDL